MFALQQKQAFRGRHERMPPRDPSSKKKLQGIEYVGLESFLPLSAPFSDQNSTKWLLEGSHFQGVWLPLSTSPLKP